MSGHDLSQPLNLYRVPDGIMQVFVIGIHPSTPINRPYVVVRLGDQSFQTSVSKSPTGNWNEGFELIVSYHTQLFGTVHMDVYSNNTLLPDSLIGRAEIKISLLEGFPEIFTSYYEIWDKKLAASTPAGADGSKSALGFVQVDEDTVPSSVENTLESEASTKESGASSNWFTELFAGAQAAPQADTSSDVAAAAKATSSDESKAQNTASETSKTAKEKSLMQSLSSMFISPSTFMAIKSLERLVGMFNQGVELSNTEMLGGLLTLYKFYNEADIPGVSCPHSGQIVEGVSKLELSGRYARFALASYGWRALYFFNRGITLMDGAKVDSDVTSVLQYLHIRPEDLLGYEFRSSQLFCPSYFVAHDRQCDAVVLVVRGTMSAEDTVVDLSCEYTKWNGGLVHSGMKASAQWLFLEVVPQIFAYASSQNIRSIRIVGHSLGASTAAILTIMLQESRLRLSELGVGISQFDIHAYCYGPAPCVSDNIADRHRDCIDTFVNRDDLVPRLCYGSMSDFKRMSISAADEADNLAQRLYAPFEDINQQQQRWQERFARLMKIRNDVLAAQENLHLALPGTTYHIVSYPPSDKFVPVWIQKVSNDSFREIILRPTIITDHMPSAYELALAHAIETQVYEHPLRDRRKK
ncbi:Alpha/Beta hydrolase protein [Coemansia mojavensis]|nr:Alpha/Beta hydrolase protein [Coemansia mojavensis]